MMSMYENIMNLPLFKGISREQVSAILEKIPVSFITYKAGDKICSSGDKSLYIDFIFNGRVKVSRTSEDKSVAIDYTRTVGGVIGADSLFGINTTFLSSVTAVTDTTLLRLPKEEYIKILATDTIYILNILNYLSRGLQYARNAAINFNRNDIFSLLVRWVMALTDRKCDDICIRLAHSLDLDSLKQCARLQREGLIEVSADGIHILNSDELIDYYYQN